MSSYHALPFLIMNYGAQMLFILQQRLLAQNVTPEKGSRVLSDVVRSLFAPEFIAELMRPQPLYTPQGVREVFDKLAQSSIMRLSPSSMDKLYDLMTMGVKHMLVTSRFPTDLIESTLNHMDALVIAISGGPDAPGVNPAEFHKDCKVQELAAAIEAFRLFSGRLCIGELADVRCSLLSFFQSKRVKVSLFLQEKLQNSDGTFNVPYGGRQSHHSTSFVPGKFIYYEGTGKVVAEAPYPNVHLSPWQPSAALPGGSATFDPFNPAHRTTTLGRNIYLSDRKKTDVGGLTSPRSPDSTTGPPTTFTQVSSPSGRPPPSSSTAPPVPPVKASSSSQLATPSSNTSSRAATPSTAALNTLVGMLGNNTATTNTQFIRISNLFGEEDGGGTDSPISLPTQQVIKISAITREEAMKANQELTGVISGFGAFAGQDADDDDLLALMDRA